MDFYERLGARLRAYRRRADLSQAALGARLGLTAGAINRYERGHRRVPLRDVPRIASVLGIAPAALVGTAWVGGRGIGSAAGIEEEAPAYGRRRFRPRADARSYAKSISGTRLRALAKQAGLGADPPAEALRRYAELIAKDYTRRRGSTRGRLK
jgi:transcriptional regulator with XRE-family HTH domain